MKDLWPSDIGGFDEVAPIAILKEQASLLGKKMSNIIEGLVQPVEEEWWSSSTNFHYAFFIDAPTLQYSYRLFVMAHPVDFYPIKLKLNQDIAVETFPEADNNQIITLQDEDQFINALSKVFGARKTRRVIGSLLAQSGALSNRVSEIPTEDDIPF